MRSGGKCPNCNNGTVATSVFDDLVATSLGPVCTRVPVLECGACGEVWEDEETSRARELAVQAEFFKFAQRYVYWRDWMLADSSTPEAEERNKALVLGLLSAQDAAAFDAVIDAAIAKKGEGKNGHQQGG